MDFEWREKELIVDIDNNSSTSWRLLSDGSDGTVYSVCFLYNNSSSNNQPRSLVVSKYNPTEHHFEELFTENYISYLLDCIVYDGRFYFLYERNDSVLVRTDDGSDIHITDYSKDSNAWYFEGPRFVTASDGHLFILTYYRAWERDVTYRYYFHANITKVSSQNNSVRDVEILDLTENIIGCKFIEADGTVHLMLERLTGNLSELMMYGYGLTTLVMVGPIEMFSAVDTRMWSFVPDSAGDVHLAIANGTYDDYSVKLVKLSGTGDALSTTQLPVWLQEPRMLVNGPDHLYLIGAMRVVTTEETHLFTHIFDKDHSAPPIVTRHNKNRWFWTSQCLFNANDELIMAWDEWVGFLEYAYYTCQTPMTPDLEMLGQTFTFREVANDEEPVHISYQVRNRGNVTSKGWTIEILLRDRMSGEYVRIFDRIYDIDLEIDATVTINHSLKLPQGNNMVWLAISDVDPYENNRRNNDIRTWVFVSRNNPPTLEVYEPLDGAVVDEQIVVSGYCDDIDVEDNLKVIIEGLPKVVRMDANGSWAITIDTLDLPSEDLIITVTCTDGTDLSRAINRRIRIDHEGDTLKVHSVLPAGDVKLLLWETVAFSVNASEMFGRPILYTWTTPEGQLSGSPLYIYKADTIGTFTISVNISNGYIEHRHSWEMHVREPVYPFISAAAPMEETITINKGDTVDLSITVVDDDDQSHSIIWTLRNEPIGYTDVTNVTLVFNESGEYPTAVHVISSGGVDTRHWSIEVVNRPPVVEGWTPLEPSIDIERARTLEFSIDVNDPDGDPLSYFWTSTRMTINHDDQDNTSIRLGYFESETYTVTVEVTDGEDTVQAEWTIVCEPAVQSNDPNDFTLYIVLAVLIVAIALGIYWYRFKR